MRFSNKVAKDLDKVIEDNKVKVCSPRSDILKSGVLQVKMKYIFSEEYLDSGGLHCC